MFKILVLVSVIIVPVFALSPESLSTVSSTEKDLKVFNRVGNATALTDDPGPELFNTPWPDGSKVLYDEFRDSDHKDIYTVPTNGSMVKTKISSGNNTYAYPDVNNSGTYVCYSTGDDNNDFFEIAIMTYPGAVETIITNNEATYGLDSVLPRFNGSGSKIAHVQRDWDTATDRIVTTNTNGAGEVIVCTLSPGSSNLIVSMDWLGSTNYLIFVNSSGYLYKVTASAGSTPVQIGSYSDYVSAHSNADGSEIITAETWDDTMRYVKLNPDGTGRTTLVRPDYFPMFDDIFQFVCWTASGDGLIFLAALASTPNDYDLFLVDESEYSGIKSASLGTIKAVFK